MKNIVICSLLSSFLFSADIAHANPGAAAAAAARAARAADAIRKEQMAARAAQEQIASRNAAAAANASRVNYARQQAAARSRAAFEQQASRQAATKHTEFLRVNAQQAEANRQRLAIQSHVKQQVDIAKRNLQLKPAATMAGRFNSNANAGLIYQRRTGATDVYIGQTKSLQRFPVRQTEHARNLKTQSSYELVGGAPSGQGKGYRDLLRVAEQAAYDAQTKFATKLNWNVTNAVRPMSQIKYKAIVR